jgi:methylglyoxal synthase
VDNTTDADKPLSTATNTALDTKVDKVTGERLINAAEITKLSNQSGTNTGDQDLSALATNANLDLKVDKVTGERLINVAEITKLSNQSGTNTGDQDLSSYATNANLDLKVDKVTGERLINAAEITKLSNQSGTNTGDQDLSALATNANLDLKVDKVTGERLINAAEITKLSNQSGINTGDQDLSALATNANLDLKVDKVAGERLINAAEITKLSNQSGTNTGDQDLSSYATNTNLALKANLASPTFTGTVSGIDKTMVGLGNVDNTTDADKPVSTATNTALDLKANLASPTFTGTPILPTGTTGVTQEAGNNSTALATTAFVTAAASSSKFVDLTTVQTVAGDKTFTGRIFGKTAFLNGGDGTFGNAFLVNNNDSGFLASYNTLGTIRTGYLSFSSGNSVTLMAEETNSLILGAGNQNTLTLGADQKATFAGGAVINGQTDINGSLFASNGTFSQRVTGKTAFLNGGDGTFGNAFLVTNNDSGFLASYNGLGTIRTGYLGFSSGNSVTLKAEETNSLILGAGNQNTLTLGADQNATLIGNVTATSFIKSGGTSSQFLKADGTVDSTSYASLASPTFTGIPTLPTGTIGVTQGAGNNTTALATTAFVTDAVTTATNGAFVDLTTNQSIAGLKTFSSDLNVNGVTVGRGNSNENSNTAFGLGALGSNVGYTNTGIGTGALAVNVNGDANTALGYAALTNNVSGKDNVAIGRSTLLKNISGSSNTAIGKNADIANDGISNSIAIGANAIVTASNTIQLGSDGSGSHTAITDVKTSGSLTAAGYKIPSGTASQFLMANGSVSTVLEVADEFSATASQTSFTLTQTPSINSKVKMYVNGIRISNTAYSSSGTTLTYVPANNGAYSLQIGDRIQFDYYY